MHRLFPRLAVSASILAACAGGSHAQTPAAQPAQPRAAGQTAPAADLPDGKAVIAKSIEATGGKAAFEKITSSVTTGTFEMPAQNMKAAMKVEQSGDKMRISIDVPGMGQMLMGTDGKVAWSMDPMQGPRVLTGAEGDAIKRQAARNPDLRLDEFYTSVKTIGVEEVDGKPAYKVELVPKSGKPEVRFYDKESGLLIKNEVTQTTQMGEVKGVTTMSEYREFGGVKIACLSTTKVMGFEQRIRADKVEHNVEIPDAQFAPPDDVKKLLEKPAETPKPAEPPKTPTPPR